ncbi:hypothetical protein [Brevundimonas sp. FT23042]|uniref:hypothetical protein n=1 Tax=Brevundimonas sp. FT23042 TaxID=3393749 RepID=UPI003B589995
MAKLREEDGPDAAGEVEKTLDVLGASASTAGDVFHELWALRKVLTLLAPQTDLISVKVEGVPDDERHAQVGASGQAADITEVRQLPGGERIIYEQLKYSVASPDSAWSWSRLLAPRVAARPKTCVLGKLAGLYEDTKGERVFRIVTNQPLSEEVRTDLETLPDRLRRKGQASGARVDSLLRATGLSRKALANFLDCLDLDAFGEASRLRLETGIVQTLGKTTDADARDDLDRLQQKVASLILPENRNHPPVDAETLLTWLGAGADELLKPAKSEITVPQPFMERDAIPALLGALTSANGKILRLHAGGGCGKTSLVASLGSRLPPNSELVIYDCYGGGLFMNSDQRRHEPQQAFVQAANDLAGRVGSPFILRRSDSGHLTAAFRRRIEAASRIVKARDPDALAVIVFDAVDNARIAATHWNERCFLDELFAVADWPENIRIVVTCRTGRRPDVGGGGAVVDFELKAFDLTETRRYLALVRPGFPEGAADNLHDLTGGTPRRLAYALRGLGADGYAEAVSRLSPRAPGLEPLFEKNVAEAGSRIGGPDAVMRLLSALGRLPRPTPSWALAKVADVLEDDITDIANDLGGLDHRPDGWIFIDEDFEAFARDKTEDLAPSTLEVAADQLMASRETDAYAARSVAEALMAAGRLDALYGLIGEEIPKTCLPDALDRRGVQARRLVLALRCARRADDIVQSQSLLLEGSRALRTDTSVQKLLVEHLRLSVAFSAPTVTRLIQTQDRHRNARGRLRLVLAIDAARAGNAHDARDHLRWWDAWLQDNQTRSGRDRASVTHEMIHLELEIYRLLWGEDAAINRLRQWSPLSSLTGLSIYAARAALKDGDVARVRRLLAQPWIRPAALQTLAALLLTGEVLTPAELAQGLEAAARGGPVSLPPVREARGKIEDLLILLEVAAGHSELTASTMDVLTRCLPLPTPETAPSPAWTPDSGDLAARIIALRRRLGDTVVAVTDLYPLEKKLETRPEADLDKNELKLLHERNADRERANAARSKGIALLEALVAVAEVRLADPGSAVTLTAAPPKSPHRRGAEPPPAAHRHLAMLGAADILRRDGDVDGIEELLDAVGNPTGALVGLERLVRDTGRAEPFANLLVSLADQFETEAGLSSERAGRMMRCARLANLFDPDLARNFYDRALAVADQADVESLVYLEAACAVGSGGALGTDDARRDLAERLADAAGAVSASLGDDVDGSIPWGEILQGCAALHSSTALATAGRWRDAGPVTLRETIDALTDDETLAALAPIQRHAVSALADIYPAISPETAEDMEAFVRTRLVTGRRDALYAAVSTVSAASAQLQNGAWARRAVDGEAALNAGRPRTAVAGVTRATPSPPAELRTIEEVRAAVQAERDDGRNVIDFSALAMRIKRKTLWAPTLDILVEAFSGQWSLGHFLSRQIIDWSDYPPVADRAKILIPAYIADNFPRLSNFTYNDTALLEDLLEASGLADAAKIELLLGAVERHGDELRPEFLIALVGVIGRLAGHADRSQILDKLLTTLVSDLSRPAAPTMIGMAAPHDPDLATARFLFALLGDADPRVRWRATHAVRALARRGETGFLAALVPLLTQKAETVFARPDLVFYDQAARLQLAIALARIAFETPTCLGPHLAEIAAVALDDDPHVLFKHFLKSTVLELDRRRPGVLPPTVSAAVQGINVSVFPTAPETAYPGHKGMPRTRPGERYHFDDREAVAKLFQPAAEVFNVDTDVFCERAEAWIIDQWGLSATQWHWAEEPRPGRLNAHEGGTDRLSRQAELHAMFCVMGELLRTTPESGNAWTDGFEDWLNGYALTEDPIWLADLLGPPPFEPRFWDGPVLAAEEDVWLREVPQSRFDAELSSPVQTWNVAGAYSYRDGPHKEHVRISTALVTPESAVALGRALQTARDPFDYAIPEAGGFHEIEEPGYDLTGWLSLNEREPRIDEYDPRRGDVRAIPFQLDPATQGALGLTRFPERGGWATNAGAPLSLGWSCWDSLDDETGAAGWRGWATSASLSQMLTAANRSLLAEVTINRVAGSDHNARRRRHRRLYVIDANLQRTAIAPLPRGAGAYWVRKLGLASSVDTLGRWLIHHIVELEERSRTDPAAAALLLQAADRLHPALARRRR